MAENYGSLEGVLNANETLEGEIDSHDEMSGKIQFSGGVGGVKDVQVNNESVVDVNKVAHIDLTPYAEKEDVYDKQTIDTALEGKANTSDIPTALSQLDNDDNYVQDADYHHTDNNFTDEDKAAIGNIPENITDLSDVEVSNIQNGQVLKWDSNQNKFVNANESGGGGDVTDVKVDGTSVVDPVTGEADIDLTGKADKVLDAVAGEFAILLANGNVGNSGKSASDMASKAEMSVTTSGDQTTIQLKSGTSATVINQHQDISGKADKSSLGTAAEKNSTALIVVGSTDLAEAGAVREAIDSAVASSYHHAGTKTCAELVSSLLVRANEGNVYNMTDSGVTTADFIEGAGKPIEEGANVGIAKIAENTYKFDLLSGFIDTSNFIEKSVTSGFVKNDGSIDTNTYQQTEAGKGLSTNDYDNTAKGIVDGVTSALAGKVDKETGKGLSTNDYTTAEKNKVATIDNKADKVSSATNGNLAGLNGSGNPTDSGWNGAKDTTSISGNPISIPNLKSNQLAVNPIIIFEPIQAGSGTPSPSNIRAISGYDKIEVLSGGNIWNEEWEQGYYQDRTGTKQSSTNYIRCKDKIRVTPNTTYYVYSPNNLVIYSFNSNGTYVRAIGYNISNSTITTGANDYFIVFNTAQSGISSYSNNISINANPIDTSYHKATSISESLGQTVYWGRLNVRTGEFEVLGKIIRLNSLQWGYVDGYFNVSIGLPADCVTVAILHGYKCFSSKYNAVQKGYLSMQSGELVLGDAMWSSVVRLIVKDSRFTDVTSFTNSLTNDDTLVYPLATPFTIQLTPHEISLLKDYAYVSTNGTNIALDYHNGELASLADTAQVGETLNELEDKVSANDAGTQVNLMTYNTSTNKYVCPSDGYISLSNAGASVGDYIIMSVYGANDNLICGLRCDTSVASIVTVQNLFVKRGMKCYVRATSSTGSFTALFTQLS